MKITITGLTKKFQDQLAVDDFSAVIESGQLVSLLGPSGCGKSTLLNMLSGITPSTNGTIMFGDDDVTHVPAQKRGVGLVFQNYALYPHMTVLENIAFPLEIQKVPKKQRNEKAKEIAKLVKVDQYINRKPGQLSGGQQQRVAIARALIKNPRVLLLDEPLSNLDARLRIEMREEIRRIQQKTGITTIFVTHDQEEAMSISDNIIIMKEGVLQQKQPPQELYDDPKNCFVADFLGSPPINKIPARIQNNQLIIEPTHIMDEFSFDNIISNDEVYLSCRSESIYFSKENGIPCEIKQISVMGKEKIVTAKVFNTIIRATIEGHVEFDFNEQCFIKLRKNGVFVFDKNSGERFV